MDLKAFDDHRVLVLFQRHLKVTRISVSGFHVIFLLSAFMLRLLYSHNAMLLAVGESMSCDICKHSDSDINEDLTFGFIWILLLDGGRA